MLMGRKGHARQNAKGAQAQDEGNEESAHTCDVQRLRTPQLSVSSSTETHIVLLTAIFAMQQLPPLAVRIMPLVLLLRMSGSLASGTGNVGIARQGFSW